jgi:hypothetical protein
MPLGTIDQTISAKEVTERGVSANSVPALMIAGQAVEFFGGSLPSSKLLPVTFISHSFWFTAGTATFMGRLISLSKNVGIRGSLFLVAGPSERLAAVRFHRNG